LTVNELGNTRKQSYMNQGFIIIMKSNAIKKTNKNAKKKCRTNTAERKLMLEENLNDDDKNA